MLLTVPARLATRFSTWSNFVVNKLRLVMTTVGQLYLNKQSKLAWAIITPYLLFHGFLVVHRVTDINVGGEW